MEEPDSAVFLSQIISTLLSPRSSPPAPVLLRTWSQNFQKLSPRTPPWLKNQEQEFLLPETSPNAAGFSSIPVAPVWGNPGNEDHMLGRLQITPKLDVGGDLRAKAGFGSGGLGCSGHESQGQAVKTG